MAYYVGFDLDETLGRFSSPYGHIFLLAPEVYYRLNPDERPRGYPTIEISTKARNAFHRFARCLAEKEPGLGMLRPGIVQILQKLMTFKEEGRIKGILIYSNNGNLGLLYLAAAMIEHLVGRGPIFCNMIDWFHPIRIGSDVRGAVGVASKTALTLRKAFVESGCVGATQPNQIPNSHLIFFDDLDPPHEDLHTRLGQYRYFKVNPYKFDAELKPIDDCFIQAIRDSGLENDETYYEYIKPILAGLNQPATYDGLLGYLRSFNDKFVYKREYFSDDTVSILERLDGIFPPLPSAPPASSSSSSSSAAAPISPSPSSAPVAPVYNEPPLNSYGYNYFPVSGGRKLRRRVRKTRARRARPQKRKTRARKARKI